MHSLVAELWDEWSTYEAAGEQEVSSEVCGIIAGFLCAKNADGFDLVTSRLVVMRRLLTLWKASRWGAACNITDCVQIPASKKGRVHLLLPSTIFQEISLWKDHLPWAWARGVWGSSGALYIPKSGYYLVLRLPSQELFAEMKRLLAKAKISWNGRLIHGKEEIILRNQEEIVSFLSKMGLTAISLAIEDKAIMRSMRDRANRTRNCDTANIKKTLKAAEAQTEIALRLQREHLMERLPLSLRALVEARLAAPEISLSELGASLDPPVTKSTVKYRWKKLCAFGENSRTGG